MRSRHALTALLLCFPAATARADEAAEFDSKVLPILKQRCYACHSHAAGKAKGGLVLDSRGGWAKGGDSGPAVVPGKPDDSLLIKAVRHKGELAMPPKAKLPEAEVATLVEWVRKGAADPRVEANAEARRADTSWWSLQRVRAPEPPAAAEKAWDRHPIDRFVFAKLAERGLKPGPPADPRTLIRRMSYDVTGLPPTAEEVDAFTKAHRRDPVKAVEDLADRLLASPHYGEQWGRHWLDVVRFGESNGFERNFIIDDLWPFRDYVIKSFNDDKPFNRLVVEHLAGDVVGKDDPAVEVGTAFLVCGPFDDVGNQDPVAQANIRAATLDEIIRLVAQ